jgi:hypothetical protein
MSAGVGKYRLGPFLLASEIPLPELDSLASEHGPADVTIRVGIAPDHIDQVVANESRWWASREEYLLRVPAVATFLVRRGCEVIVQPAADALPGDIRAYLLSPIFSVLCYQSGMYSLHASAVRVGDGVVAFLGDSGAGKSTLAACLRQRGYTVIADDSCLLDTRQSNPSAEAGPVLVVPVAPALKLWRSAAEQLGVSPADHPRVFSRDDKYRLKLPQAEDLDLRLPLREVLFLEWAEAADALTTFTLVEGVAAITRLMEATHFDHMMKAAGRLTGNFLLCGRILAHARAFTFRRPRNFAHIDAVIDALEHHFADEPSQAGRS